MGMQAVELGSRWLSRADALFLRRLLSAEVPQKDWKKLNRKATFKMKYKARSVEIQSMLQKLLKTFEDNKKDAEDKEKKAKDTYDKLKKSKSAQLSTAEKSLSKGDLEKGAAAVSKSDAEAEIKDL